WLALLLAPLPLLSLFVGWYGIAFMFPTFFIALKLKRQGCLGDALSGMAIALTFTCWLGSLAYVYKYETGETAKTPQQIADDVVHGKVTLGLPPTTGDGIVTTSST